MRRLDTPGRSQVFAENGIVATSHPLASSTALSILRDGGSAVDAAIAASMVLSVVEPQMTGIGGDCFAIIHDPKQGGIHAVNGSGRSSAKAEINWFFENDIIEIVDSGVHSITVPGALKAFDEMHQKFGKLEWTQLFGDAISTARNGFAVSPRVAFDWARNDDALLRDEGSAQHLLLSGRVPELGERMKFEALANTLEKISEYGIAPFYEGEFAAEIASVIAAKGGLLDEEDLANVTCDWVEPISTEFAGHEVLEIPPNGSGMVTLIMMNLMEILDVHSYAPDSAERYHLEIEIGRVAYSVRDAMLADPEHMEVPVEELISKEYAQKLAGQISKLRRNDKIVLPEIPSSDTVYLTVADKDGQIVSLIYSVFTDFGSKIVTPNSGIVLQSRGACFNLIPGHPNVIGPSKRPLHTIIPAMAKQDGKPSYSFGVMGGAYQPMGQSHVFANLEKYGFDPQTALDYPRLFWGKDGVLEAESGLSRSVLGGLEARGHKLRSAATPIGGGQIIKVDPSGFYCAGSDPRKDGFAIGY
ncbi:gamma-glutamyltransferase family protein [Lentilitoribacter sp. Alg239-R112]|uniref:gamma-glutamyltransferase family protein n=1 Tax=Lentilitoribacter sp. Alg239-R112 TaxID=2305987 RepID=UPI0013A6BACC|nr:gamma-glutamyltransferase family protein [Lentilitoribacter sp. Alg239-R112]